MIALAALLIVGLIAGGLVAGIVYGLPKLLKSHQEERQRLYVAAQRGFVPAFAPEMEQNQPHVPTTEEIDEWWSKQEGSVIPVPDDLIDIPQE